MIQSRICFLFRCVLLEQASLLDYISQRFTFLERCYFGGLRTKMLEAPPFQNVSVLSSRECFHIWK